MRISKRSLFDFAIVGAGISGASSAYFLKKLGNSVVVIERDKIASGGSGVAGAFLSPKICSNSPYTSFINEAFNFSINFYKENFSRYLRQDGLLRLLREKQDIEKCGKYEDIMPDFKYLKTQNLTKHIKSEACGFGGYFFKDGALIQSVDLIEAMLQDIDILESLHVETLNYVDGWYEIGDIKAKSIVLCVGNSTEFPQLEYCMLKGIYGHRVDVETETNIPFHLHKLCSISSSRDGIVHIGATHIPRYRYENHKSFEKELDNMLKLAKSYISFDGFKVKKVHFGVRNSTKDFYPAIGRVINVEETLKKFPYIKRGTLVPKNRYIYYPNMFIHAGLGARGFVLAPKTAEILAKSIHDKSPIDRRLDTQRLFLKYAKNSL